MKDESLFWLILGCASMRPWRYCSPIDPMSKPDITYDVRNVAQRPRPGYAVVKIDKNGISEDIAWFFDSILARAFIEVLEQKQTKRKKETK